MPTGDHTLEVWSSSGTRVDIDAFTVDIATVGAGTYDDTNSQLKWIGSWQYATSRPGAYLGTIHYTNAAEAAFRFTFVGNQISYAYSRDVNRGKAAITIDGVNRGYIDQYAPTTERLVTTTFSGLGPGVHTLHVAVSGQKNAASSDYHIDVDRITVP